MTMSARLVRSLSLLAAIVACLMLASPAEASISQAKIVSPTPASWTPRVILGSSGQTVYAFAQVGSTMYAGGRFTQLNDSQVTQTSNRSNFVAFNATTGAILPLRLDANNAVEVIVPSPDGKAIYIGGDFTSIGGVNIRGMVRFDLTTQTIDTRFNPQLDGVVTDAAFVGSRLVVAGTFTRQLRAIDPATGVDTGYINLKIAGKTDPNDATRVRRLAANPAGTTLVALGNFTSVAGQARTQAFRIDLTGTKAALSPWHVPRLDTPCSSSLGMFSRGVDFSPDGSYFVIVTTGGPHGTTGLCDAAARFETSNVSSSVEPTWINWTGGDSLYSVAITGATVYVGGHQRWLDNPLGSDSAGPGAVSRPGIGSIDPVSGRATSWNPTKDRNHGTEKLYATAAGLWVGSDGTYFDQLKRPGIVFCPLT
ncbi:MAG: delta-60 repeat domain-containing protein [Acidimicrobiia bacterium]|nr:delta-60 repeat domain-containing protein [Acidimicrobiia bacterium]